MDISAIYKTDPRTITPSASVRDALKLMIETDINALVIVNNSGLPVGVLSVQDIAAATVPEEMQAHHNLADAMFKPGFFAEASAEVGQKPVQEIMRTDFPAVTPKTNIVAITADFLHHDLYVVPVLEGTRLVGIVTRSEIRRALALGMELISE